MNTHAIMFHHFHNEGEHIKQQGSIGADEFEELLDYYEQEGFQIISVSDYIQKVLSKTIRKEEVCLTFDDSLRCQYDIAIPILNKRGIKALFFIYTSPFEKGAGKLEIYRHFRHLMFRDIDKFYQSFFQLAAEKQEELKCDITSQIIGFKTNNYIKEYKFYTYNDRLFRWLRDVILGQNRYEYLMDNLIDVYQYNTKFYKNLLCMDERCVKDLAIQGHTIGLHTHSHPTELTHFEYIEQEKEYKKNKEILQEIIKEPIVSVSYPCGSYNNDTLKIMKQLGIKLGFLSHMQNNDIKSTLEIPRQDHSNIIKDMRQNKIKIFNNIN